ncbi:jg464, partial [Pararge aegeria aegeria]
VNHREEPACLRILDYVLKGVLSPPIRTGPAWRTALPLLIVGGTCAL